jgi:hypothetical protein
MPLTRIFVSVASISTPPLDLAPEAVDQRVELGWALLERLVGLAGEHDELGVGDPLGHDPAVAWRGGDVELTGNDECGAR